MEKISLIIPIAFWDYPDSNLIEDIARINGNVEVIFSVSGVRESTREIFRLKNRLLGKQVVFVFSGQGRGVAQNKAASVAGGDYLWFLHADSRFEKDTFENLKKSITKHPDALHYFQLKFLNDGGPAVFLNELGAKIRSYLGVPFGDQGFCIKRELFSKVGGFNENAKYGEDHLFVWSARQLGIELRCTGCKLLTSARKYKKYGWLNLTLRYQFLWIKQALPCWVRLRMGRS